MRKMRLHIYIAMGVFLAMFIVGSFLDLKITPTIICPYCGEEPEMEIGPDEEMQEAVESAKLIEMVEGENVEKYDTLLSLAITGGDYSWI